MNTIPSGIEINGIIEQYQIAAGENISAGNFVEYVNKIITQGQYCTSGTSIYQVGTNTFNSSNIEKTKPLLIDDNTVIVFYPYDSNYLACSVLKMSAFTNRITIHSSTIINNTINSGAYFEIKYLTNNKYFIVYSDPDNSLKKVAGKIYSIEIETSNISVSVSTPQIIVNDDGHNMFLSQIDNNNYLLLFPDLSTDAHYLQGIPISINNDNVIVYTLTTISNVYNAAKTSGRMQTIAINNDICIAHSFGSNSYINFTMVNISNNNISIITNAHSDTYRYYTYDQIIFYDNNIFVFYYYNSSSFIVRLSYIENTLIIEQCTEIMSNNYARNGNSCMFISKDANMNNQYILIYISGSNIHQASVNYRIMTINNDYTISIISQGIVFSEAWRGIVGVNHNNINCILCPAYYNTSTTSWNGLYAHLITWKNGIINLSSSENILGIAAELGSEYDTIDVYIPSTN